VSSAAPSPFAVLGIAPTGDMIAVKRAYFAGLARHPPHADPEGFRTLRTAYEALMAPGGLQAALALAPPDPQAELARYRERFDARLAEAAAAATQASARTEAAADFKQALMRMSLTEALAAFSAG
jgi:hypothetical protein